MGETTSITTCGNTVHKESKHDIEPKQKATKYNCNPNNIDKHEYQHHNPLYNQYASKSKSNYKHPKASKRILSKSKKHNSIPADLDLIIHNTDDLDMHIAIDSDDNILDDHLGLTLQDYHHHHDNDALTPSKRRIKYRERHETHGLIDSNNNNKYLKYKKYKKLRARYLKMDQFIDNLLSLNCKNLQHILILRKTDNININNFYRYILSDQHRRNKSQSSLHLPQLKRVSESLSFYAVSFRAINNSRKLWHILLQDQCRQNIVIHESRIRCWTKQLLLAVHFLHKHNIVHLDISPESIIICNDADRLILSGFDASMLVNDHITYNLNSELLNSCWQLPPSIRRRNDFNGFECKAFDMWSIGVLVFLLLTAKFPFFKDKRSKRIPESSYVSNEQRLSHHCRDFIGKLLSSNIGNRMTAASALQHPWIASHREHNIKLDGSIYGNMYQHHQQKLKLKYAILAQETKQCLFVCDQKRLNKKIKKLNRKICKYQQCIDEENLHEVKRRKSKYGNKRSSLNLSKSHTKYLTYNDYADAESEDSTSLYLSASDAISESSVTETSSSRDSAVADTAYYRQKNKQLALHKSAKKRKHHSDSLRITAHKYDIKKRNRSNSTATYGEYRANNSVNKIDVEKWQGTKKGGDEEEHIKKQSILSPLISHTHEVHEQYPSTNTDIEQKHNLMNTVHISPSHNQQQTQRHQMHFVRSQHLTPTNAKKNCSGNIPIYSRGTSGHNTNVTTPNPTSSSTQPNNNNPYEDRFKFKIKHQHKTSYGNLIAIERSVGPQTSPKQSPKLATINQYISYDMLTNDPPQQTQQPFSARNVRQIPRRPLLPPRIIKLESPSQTVNGNLSSSSSEKEDKKHNQPPMHVQPQLPLQGQRRSFQITRRPLSPVKQLHDEHDCLDINEEINVAVHKRPSMLLISHSTTNVGHERQDTHSSGQIDFLSGAMSNKHPINEYDPLDLNDSTLKKAKWIPPQLVIQTTSPSPSPPQQQQQLHTFAYPILSMKNLSLHQQQLDTNGNNSTREEVNTHTKDLSGSSGLILQDIVKNHALLRAPENSDSNFTSNSKAVIRNMSSVENTKSKSNISGNEQSPKQTRSAMDLLKMHTKGTREYVDYLSMPPDDNADITESVRSSVMSLENILQARGLYKKDQIKTSRAVALEVDDKKEKSEQDTHHHTNTDSITDSRSLLEHILEYAPSDNNNANDTKVDHDIVADDEESKQEECNAFVAPSPKGDYSYDAHVDDIGMYTQLDPHLLLNNPAIQIRHHHQKRKIVHVHNRSSSGRATLYTSDSNSNCITPPSTTDYKPHSHIHHNMQRQLQQSESQNEIIHPVSPQPPPPIVPITSPLTHTKPAHYSYGSSNLHNKKRSLYNKCNQTNVVENIHTDSSEEERSSLSALSPNISPPVAANHNKNNDGNRAGQSVNSFVANNKPKPVKSNSRNHNKQLRTNSSAESSANTGENDKSGGGRTSTY